MTQLGREIAHETIFLNHTVPQLFSSHRYLTKLTQKLWEHGIRRVGQLIQLTEEDLRKLAPRTTPSNIQEVVDTLARLDLKLGMDTNGWKNPDFLSRKMPRVLWKKAGKAAVKRPVRAAASRRSQSIVRRRVSPRSTTHG